LINDTYIRST